MPQVLHSFGGLYGRPIFIHVHMEAAVLSHIYACVEKSYINTERGTEKIKKEKERETTLADFRCPRAITMFHCLQAMWNLERLFHTRNQVSCWLPNETTGVCDTPEALIALATGS